MSFADIKPQGQQFKQPLINKVEFMSLTQGVHLIRILDAHAYKTRAHYLNKVTVECLGDECPICANNKQIIAAFPEGYRKNPSYNRSYDRFAVNVFDMTDAKICPKCGKEEKNTSLTRCTDCNEQLPEPAPLNKVKVLARGVTLFEHLEQIHSSVLDENGEPIGINNFDITLVVSGTGRETTYTPIPNPNNKTKIPDDLELFDLSSVTLRLEPGEMLDLQRGVSLRDIFAARHAKNEKSVDTPQVDEEVFKQVNDKISQLFVR